MRAKEFLNQAYQIEQRIRVKRNEIMALRNIAAGCSVCYDGMPKNPSPSGSLMEDTILKIVALEEELRRKIDSLVALKAEILRVIEKLEQEDYRLILEKRYLCLESWDNIADDLVCSRSWVMKKHKAALCEVDRILDGGAEIFDDST